MSAAPRRPSGRGSRPVVRARLWQWIASGTALAVFVTLAIVAAGFDSRETPRDDPSVWVARAGGQYARVNTETAEIDTVRQVENPSAVVQSDGLSLLLTQAFGRAWVIDEAAPQDIRDEAAAATDDAAEGDADPDADAGGAESAATAGGESETGAGGSGEADGAIRTPDGTRQVIAASSRVLFLTERGEVLLSRVQQGATAAGETTLTVPERIDPRGAEEGDTSDGTGNGADRLETAGYFAAAAALDTDGRVALFSPEEGGLRWYDSVRGEFEGGVQATPDGVPDDGVQLAIVGGEWVLFDSASGTLWRDGSTIELEVEGTALLQGSATAAQADDDAVLIADERGLWRVTRDGAERIVDARGVPARPEAAADMVAAWVSTDAAQLWTASGGAATLDFDETVTAVPEPAPVIRTSGSRAVVAETATGMLWTAPEGQLIPLEQWSLLDPPREERGEVITRDVTEQEPPVAVADTFGVRAGEPALLPVLLNDYDPNHSDVLTIVREGLGDGFPPTFGSVNLLSDGQGVTVQPSPGATGTATFTYRITDGVNVSEPATVSLAVVGDAANTAPVWCAVDGCKRAWPSPEIAPGGTLILPLLEGWVDAEGDPMMLAAARPAAADEAVRALVTADGRLAVRHTDPNAGASDLTVMVQVVDARGASTERELRVRVRPGAGFELGGVAATVETGQPTVLRPLERALGGSGSFQLVDAVVQQGTAQVVVNQGAGTVTVTAASEGSSLVAVTVRDTGTEREVAGVIRVTAVGARGGFGVPPLRAFVRPQSDTTIDVLAALPGANARALTVRSALVADGQLRADVIEHARIRVSGSTADGLPGRIGAVDLVIDEGGVTASGRLTVFQVAETVNSGAIAVADTAIVRAGAVVDLPVLDNDVSPPGERLVLHPAIQAPGIEGELAFASGSMLRYLAPIVPGTYTLSYTTYGASSPHLSDVGRVRVTVVADGSNRAPQPATLTVRVAPGERVTVPVPLSGVDPDGDRVRLVRVDVPTDAQLNATMLARSSAIEVQASKAAARGTQVVLYTVRDARGGEASGTLRIIVTDPNVGGGAPVVYSDIVRISRGATDPVTVRPLDNDLDPSGGTLELISVEPNVPGGPESPAYAKLAARLDTSALAEGIVRVTGSDELGTASFTYTVRSSETTSTADGLIVVQVSERIGLQAPSVTDSVLSVRDRADFERVGVDVVTDRVRWAAGDVGELTLSLWGSAVDRYRVDGSRISGTYRAEGDLVAFRLAGRDAAGAAVETFGFLVIPPLDELRLTLRPGSTPIAVDEGESVDLAVANLVDLGAGDQIELAQGALSTQRSQARCEVTGELTVRYSAGREAPWADTCTIRVKLLEQTTYTALAVPIQIAPDDPVAQLNPLTRTIAPGQSQTIALTDMLEWQGGREGQVDRLQWGVPALSSGFTVTSSGASVQVLAHADSIPGTQQTVPITVTGAGESQAVLTLRVGEAAQDRPRGATVPLQCTVGSACATTLIGKPGEHDPFAGKPGGGLTLVSVDGSACRYGTLTADGDGVRVTWPDARGEGGKCAATYTVRDAQQRIGTGTIEFDAQGVPRAPASIIQTGYDASSVRLQVDLGEAASAHPALTGVVIDIDGGRSNAACEPLGAQYTCTVSGLEVGIMHRFTARAVNTVGDSDATSAVTAWAYRTPTAPAVEATQVSAESAAQGTLRLDMTPKDSTTGGYRVTVEGATRQVGLGEGAVFAGVSVGLVRWSVVPVSQFPAPPGDTQDGAATTGELGLAGRPTVAVAATSSDGSDRVSITVSVDANGGTRITHGYGVGPRGTTPTCDPTQFGPGGGAGPWNYSITTNKHHRIAVVACAASEWGEAVPATTEVRVGGEVQPPTIGSGFTVSTVASTAEGAMEYRLATPPTVVAAGDATLEYEVQGVVSQSFPDALSPELAAQARVRQVIDESYSSWVAIPSNVPTSVRVDTSGCIDPAAPAADLATRISTAARSFATPAYDGVTLTVTWSGDFSALTPLAVPVSACAPPPDPGTVPAP